MAEPPQKKPKLPKTPMSAFAAMTAKKQAISRQERSLQERPVDLDPSTGVRATDTKTSSPPRTSPKNLSNLKVRRREGSPVRSEKPAKQSSNETTLGFGEGDALRLRALLFPYYESLSSKGYVKSALIEDTARPSTASPFKSETQRRQGQERAVREIFSFYDDSSFPTPHATTDTEPRPKAEAQPPRFVRATADLVCAILNDPDFENKSRVAGFFESLHHVPMPVANGTAGSEALQDAIVPGDSAQSPHQSRLEGRDVHDQESEDGFSNQKYMLRATYAMAWIRFVNAFADRDIRTSKPAQPRAIQSVDNLELLPAPEPRHEEHISPSHPREPLAETAESKSNGIFESQPSFLSLNPYEVLSLQNPERDASPLSASDSPEVWTDPGKTRKMRNDSTMYAQASLVEMPLDFVDIRHQCVHGENMVPLSGEMGLRRTVRRGLCWVWDKYWKVLTDPKELGSRGSYDHPSELSSHMNHDLSVMPRRQP